MPLSVTSVLQISTMVPPDIDLSQPLMSSLIRMLNQIRSMSTLEFEKPLGCLIGGTTSLVANECK